MTVSYPPLAGAITGLVCQLVVAEVGGSAEAATAALVIGGVAGFTGWLFAPVSNTSLYVPCEESNGGDSA